MRHSRVLWLRVSLVLQGAMLVCCAIAILGSESCGYHPQTRPEAPSAARDSARAVSKVVLSKTTESAGLAQPSPAQKKTSAGSVGATPGASKPEALAPSPPKQDIIEVVLTFDDGPHADLLVFGKNYTQKVVHTLKANLLQKDIKAVFFVQTHAPGRGGNPVGREVIATAAREGHVIGIHTGSTRDHANHRARALAPRYDANRDGVLGAADGLNGLESDMVRAKARIQKLSGRQYPYVRPTYGERNRAVKAVYQRQNLKMILWDIDSRDNSGSPSVDTVNQNIHEGMRRCIAAGKKQMIILFHDINSQTALNLEEYLANICISARKLGKTVVFPTTTQRVMQILDATTYQ